jgi:hypothetical protein
MKLAVVDFRKHYLDHLESWVEVPVWNQTDLIGMVNEINWDELSLDDYKKLLVEHWPNLPMTVKTKLNNPAVRNELYDVLIHENWGLAPSEKLAPELPYYDEVSMKNVQLFFASNGSKGNPPDIVE